MKKLAYILALIPLVTALSHAQPDPFYPKNEHYDYNGDFGIITGFGGGVGSSTCAGIHISGKVWTGSGLSKDPKYNFVGWATGCAEYKPGTGITGDGTDYGASYWQDPSKAFGKATGSDTAAVVVAQELQGVLVEILVAGVKYGDFRHHRTIVSAAFAQSFAPSVQG